MIDCKICGKQYKTITLTHLKSHQLTFDDYFLKFPNAKIISEDTSKKLGSKTRIRNLSRDYSKISQKISKTKKQKFEDGTLTIWNKGKSSSEEIKQKISETRKQKFKLGKITHWNTGRVTSEETKQKISKTNTGRKFTEIQLQNLKEAMAKLITRDDYIPGFLGKKHSDESKEKIKNASKILWIQKSGEIIEDFIQRAKNENINVLSIEDNYWFNFKCNNCNNIFSHTRQIFRHSTRDGKNICSVCHPRNKGTSLIEKDFFNEIKKIWPNAISNDRRLLGGKEIDVLIPEKKIGFEFTGLYWHSENNYKEPKHLLWKQQYAHNKGIKLITIFEDEWNQKREIIISKIKSMLGLSEKIIYGRKCEVAEVNNEECSNFLDKNHIQGKDNATNVRLGLFYENNLVMVASFKRTSFVKGGTGKEWELSRMTSEININIIGGASKLIKYFIEHYSNNFPLITYADRRWSAGDVYEKINFKFIGETPPSYWYMIDYKNRIHRSLLMKHKLIKDGGKIELTEWENAKNLGYDRIWDCGTLKFIYQN